MKTPKFYYAETISGGGRCTTLCLAINWTNGVILNKPLITESEIDRINDYYECLIECDDTQTTCKRICRRILDLQYK